MWDVKSQTLMVTLWLSCKLTPPAATVALVENSAGQKLKMLRTDNGGEYLSKSLRITREKKAPHNSTKESRAKWGSYSSHLLGHFFKLFFNCVILGNDLKFLFFFVLCLIWLSARPFASGLIDNKLFQSSFKI